jgi:hypothetical protein
LHRCPAHADADSGARATVLQLVPLQEHNHMRLASLVAVLAASLPVTDAAAQGIIAQSQGLPNPAHVIDFGANLYPNFTPITTEFAGITVAHARYFTTGVSNNLVGGFLTNDFSGQPDTLSIRFANPIQDLTYVYHQIGTWQASVHRALLNGVPVYSFSNSSNQNQTNNYFGFTGIQFDELQIDFVADFNIDELAFNDTGANCQVRNGSGINPLAYSCTTRPIMGTNWQAAVGTNPNTLATFLVFAPGGAHPGLPAFGGEILIQLSPGPIAISGGSAYSIAIPNGPQWNGYSIATQAARIDQVGPTQTVVLLNAIDITIGL